MGKAVSTIKRNETTAFTVEMPPLPEVSVSEAKREWDRAAAIGVVGDLKRSTKALEDAYGKAGKPLMESQALTCFNVIDVSGLVGTKGDEPYANQEALAQAMGLKSKGYVTRLTRVGRAMVHYGVKRGSKDYGLLATQADASLFSEVLGKKEPSTLAAFREVMAKAHIYAANNGGTIPSAAAIKALEAGKDETRSAQVPTGNSEPAETPKDEAPKPMTLGDILRVIHGLEAPLTALSDESAEKVWQALVNLAAGDKRKRETLAAAAKRNGKAPAKAPAKVTPATVKVAPKATEPKAIEAPKAETPKA